MCHRSFYSCCRCDVVIVESRLRRSTKCARHTTRPPLNAAAGREETPGGATYHVSQFHHHLQVNTCTRFQPSTTHNKEFSLASAFRPNAHAGRFSPSRAGKKKTHTPAKPAGESTNERTNESKRFTTSHECIVTGDETGCIPLCLVPPQTSLPELQQQQKGRKKKKTEPSICSRRLSPTVVYTIGRFGG